MSRSSVVVTTRPLGVERVTCREHLLELRLDVLQDEVRRLDREALLRDVDRLGLGYGDRPLRVDLEEHVLADLDAPVRSMMSSTSLRRCDRGFGVVHRVVRGGRLRDAGEQGGLGERQVVAPACRSNPGLPPRRRCRRRRS